MSNDPDDDSTGLAILSGDGTGWRRRRPRTRGVLILLGVLILFLAVPVGAVGLYASRIEQSVTANLHRDPALQFPDDATRPAAPDPDSTAADAVNFLMMGSDDRDDGNGGRSDALMLLHLAADRKSAAIVSFPRDLYVDIPGHGRNKINAAYAFGGPTLAVRTIEQLLDVRIDHVARIEMDGFVELTTELGGVTVDNAHYSESWGHTFEVGEITVEGEEALAYVRERKQLPRGDLDRTERQRQVVRAIIRQGLSLDLVTDPNRFTDFVGAAARTVIVDEGLTDGTIRDLALSLRLTPQDVAVLEVPTAGTGTAGAMSIVVPDELGIAELAGHVRDDTLADYAH